jgi:hypothetical protein
MVFNPFGKLKYQRKDCFPLGTRKEKKTRTIETFNFLPLRLPQYRRLSAFFVFKLYLVSKPTSQNRRKHEMVTKVHVLILTS